MIRRWSLRWLLRTECSATYMHELDHRGQIARIVLCRRRRFHLGECRP